MQPRTRQCYYIPHVSLLFACSTVARPCTGSRRRPPSPVRPCVGKPSQRLNSARTKLGQLRPAPSLLYALAALGSLASRPQASGGGVRKGRYNRASEPNVTGCMRACDLHVDVFVDVFACTVCARHVGSTSSVTVGCARVGFESRARSRTVSESRASGRSCVLCLWGCVSARRPVLGAGRTAGSSKER